MTPNREAVRSTLKLLSSMAALACGLLGLVGWHTGIPELARPLPEWMPLSYGTSLYLIGLGLGWLAVGLGARKLSIGLGLGLAALASICFARGFEAALLRRLGLETPLAAPSPGFAGTTMLVALALTWQLIFRSLPRFRLAGSLLGGLTLAIAVVDPGALPWGMVPVTFGLGLAGLLDLRLPRHDLATAIRVVPPVAFAVSAVATVVLWRATSEEERSRVQRLIETDAEGVVQQLRIRLPATFQRFEDLAKDWQRNPGDETERHESAGGVLGNVGSAVAVYRVDSEGKPGWVESGARFRSSLAYYEDELGERLNRFAAAARSEGDWVFSVERWTTPRSGRPLLLTFFPVPGKDQSGILVVFQVEELLASVFGDMATSRNAIAMSAGGTLLFRQGPAPEDLASVPPQEFAYRPSRSENAPTWTLRVWPTESMLARGRSATILFGLFGGLVVSGLLGLTCHLFLRSRAEASRASQSDARSQALIGNLQQAVFLKDQALRYVAVNRVFCDQAGRGEAEILGRTDEELFPSDAAAVRREEEAVLADGRRREREETLAVGGKSSTLQVMRSPVRDAGGAVTGVLGVRWDVTDQRRLEAQLRQSQKMDALGKLAGGVAHDFNNLLTVMIGNLYMLRDDFGSPEDNRVLISEAEKAANRAAELVRQLLSFSRQTPIRFEAVALSGVVTEVARLVRRTIDAQVRIEASVASDLWPIQGDVSQLHQILMNLCINARDAMPEGGDLHVCTANVTLTPGQIQGRIDARPGDFVRLSVSDDGIGMTSEVRSRIFEPFFTTKGVGKGTGLGLAQVFGIAQQHGGWVECRSTPGLGTTFDLFFPRSEEASEDTGSVIQTVRSGTETILVIDDESMIRNLVQRIFTNAGYEVLTAQDGAAGIELYRSQPGIDLVMLDLNMPGLSGQETFRELLRVDPGVRVVISSGYSEEHLDARESNLVSAFLAKPFRSEDLLRVVREVLDGGSSMLEETACEVMSR